MDTNDFTIIHATLTNSLIIVVANSVSKAISQM